MKYYRIALAEAYFQRGFGKLNLVKYALALIGIDVLIKGVSIYWVFLAGFIYCIVCYLLGRLLFKIKYIDAEIEVINNINPFVKEMRNSVKRKV